MARYDRDPRWAARYDAWATGPFTAWYPGAYWAGAPMFGWGGAWAWPPYAPVGYGRYDRDFAPRLPPRQSPTYGRGGDEAARRWAREHGYDAGYEIRPRGGGRGGRRYGW